MTDETCKELAKLVNVTHLDLRYCPLTNAGMVRASAAMPRLEYCNVEGCRLTCLGIVALMRRHRNLRVWGPGEQQTHLSSGLKSQAPPPLDARDDRHLQCALCESFIADCEPPQLGQVSRRISQSSGLLLSLEKERQACMRPSIASPSRDDV